MRVLLVVFGVFVSLTGTSDAQVLSRPPANLRDIARPVLEESTRLYPQAWACAHHFDRPCAFDWIKASAAMLHAIDPRFGLNGKRGNANDLSADVITYLLDPANPRMVAAWDVCGSCGGRATVEWGEITNYATIGQPGTAIWIQPPPVAGGSVPPPTPPPTQTPSINLQPLMDALARLEAKVDALAARPVPSPDLSSVTGRLDTVSAQVDEARREIQALASKPVAVDWPEYSGRVMGTPITLRPRR